MDKKKLVRPIEPPLGPKPKWLLEEQRIYELKKAIESYMHSNYLVPEEWISEYNELIERNAETEEI